MTDHAAPLRVVCPCEHGVSHHISAVPEGARFAVPECRTTRGVPRDHHVTADRYPEEAHP